MLKKSVFPINEEACSYLASREPRLGQAMARLKPPRRWGYDDLFVALLHSITGQQISSKAQESIWQRLLALAKEDLSPEKFSLLRQDELRATGLSARKIFYMQSVTQAVLLGSLDLTALSRLSDQDFVKSITKFSGVGPWTAEMLLLFCLKREDVFSLGDLGLKRGLSVLYQKTEFSRAELIFYQKRFSPHGSVASLYLWEIAVKGLA